LTVEVADDDVSGKSAVLRMFTQPSNVL
jgi:hypothetical protein